MGSGLRSTAVYVYKPVLSTSVLDVETSTVAAFKFGNTAG